jgi:hypothetical protein
VVSKAVSRDLPALEEEDWIRFSNCLKYILYSHIFFKKSDYASMYGLKKYSLQPAKHFTVIFDDYTGTF